MKGESHPELAVSVAVSIVMSRQVSEVKKKKFSKETSVVGEGTEEARRRNRSTIPLSRGLASEKQGMGGGGGEGASTTVATDIE